MAIQQNPVDLLRQRFSWNLSLGAGFILAAVAAAMVANPLAAWSRPYLRYVVWLVGLFLFILGIILIGRGIWARHHARTRAALAGLTLHSRLGQIKRELLDRYRASHQKDLKREVSWLLLLGPKGAGKETALRQAGFVPIGFRMLDYAGNYHDIDRPAPNMTFWETNNHDVIVVKIDLDQHGRHTPYGEQRGADPEKDLHVLLRWLRRHRFIHGVVVQIGIDQVETFLAEAERDPIRQSDVDGLQAFRRAFKGRLPEQLRRRLDEVARSLRAQVPIHVVLNCCDRLVGFRGFFPTPSNVEAWGFPVDARRGDIQAISRAFSQGFGRLIADLRDRTPPLLTISQDTCLAALRFPEELRCRAEVLRVFVEVLGGPLPDPPLWRRIVATAWLAIDAPWLTRIYLASAVRQGAPMAARTDPSLPWKPDAIGVSSADGNHNGPGDFLGFYSEIPKGVRQAGTGRSAHQRHRQPLLRPRALLWGVGIAICFLGSWFIGRADREIKRRMEEVRDAAKTLQRTTECKSAGDSLAKLYKQAYLAPGWEQELRRAASFAITDHLMRLCVQQVFDRIKNELTHAASVQEAWEAYVASTLLMRWAGSTGLSDGCPDEQHAALAQSFARRSSESPDESWVSLWQFFFQKVSPNDKQKVQIDEIGQIAAQKNDAFNKLPPESQLPSLAKEDVFGEKGCQFLDEQAEAALDRCVGNQKRIRYQKAYGPAWEARLEKEVLWDLPQRTTFGSPCGPRSAQQMLSDLDQEIASFQGKLKSLVKTMSASHCAPFQAISSILLTGEQDPKLAGKKDVKKQDPLSAKFAAYLAALDKLREVLNPMAKDAAADDGSSARALQLVAATIHAKSALFTMADERTKFLDELCRKSSQKPSAECKDDVGPFLWRWFHRHLSHAEGDIWSTLLRAGTAQFVTQWQSIEGDVSTVRDCPSLWTMMPKVKPNIDSLLADIRKYLRSPGSNMPSTLSAQIRLVDEAKLTGFQDKADKECPKDALVATTSHSDPPLKTPTTPAISTNPSPRMLRIEHSKFASCTRSIGSFRVKDEGQQSVTCRSVGGQPSDRYPCDQPTKPLGLKLRLLTYWADTGESDKDFPLTRCTPMGRCPDLSQDSCYQCRPAPVRCTELSVIIQLSSAAPNVSGSGPSASVSAKWFSAKWLPVCPFEIFDVPALPSGKQTQSAGHHKK